MENELNYDEFTRSVRVFSWAAFAAALVAVMVLWIDLRIRRMILDESAALRATLEGERERSGHGGRGPAGAAAQAGRRGDRPGLRDLDDLADGPGAPAEAGDHAGHGGDPERRRGPGLPHRDAGDVPGGPHRD